MLNKEKIPITKKLKKFPWEFFVLVILALLIPFSLVKIGDMYLSLGIFLVLFAVFMILYQYFKKVRISRNRNLIVIISLILGIILVIFNYNNRVDIWNSIDYRLINHSGDKKEFTYKLVVPNDSITSGKLYRVDFLVEHTTTDICNDMMSTDHQWLFKINSQNINIQKEFTPDRYPGLGHFLDSINYFNPASDYCGSSSGSITRRLDYDFRTIPGEYEFSIISPIELSANDKIFITLSRYLSR